MITFWQYFAQLAFTNAEIWCERLWKDYKIPFKVFEKIYFKCIHTTLSIIASILTSSSQSPSWSQVPIILNFQLKVWYILFGGSMMLIAQWNFNPTLCFDFELKTIV